MNLKVHNYYSNCSPGVLCSYYFLPKNKDITLQISTALQYYSRCVTLACILLYLKVNKTPWVQKGGVAKKNCSD